MSDRNDDDLMRRTVEGDEQAFRVLVERWERPIFAFLDRMVGSREEAQDLSQETFLRVYTNADRYRSEGQFRSWLFRIAGNLTRSRLRRNRILRWIRFEPSVHDIPSGREGADKILERDETRQAVRAALDKLPFRQRQAIVLRRYDDLSYREIASAMNISVAAVESLLQRAMDSLKKRLIGK